MISSELPELVLPRRAAVFVMADRVVLQARSPAPTSSKEAIMAAGHAEEPVSVAGMTHRPRRIRKGEKMGHIKRITVIWKLRRPGLTIRTPAPSRFWDRPSWVGFRFRAGRERVQPGRRALLGWELQSSLVTCIGRTNWRMSRSISTPKRFVDTTFLERTSTAQHRCWA